MRNEKYNENFYLKEDLGRHYFIESILKGFGTRGGAVLCCVQNQNKVQGSGTTAVEENDRERERTSM